MHAHQTFGGHQPEWLVQAPGREMWIAAVTTEDHLYTVEAADHDSSVKFTHRSAKTGKTHLKRPLPDWARYPAGVVVTLGDGGLALPGFHAIILGDEPAGPRYDFSTGVAFAAFCYRLADVEADEGRLLDVAETVRREFIGL